MTQLSQTRTKVKRVLIGLAMILIPLAMSLMLGLGLLRLTSMYWGMHPTGDDAQTAFDIWNELREELSHRPDILNSDGVQIFAGPSRRWALDFTVIGVQNATDQDLIVDAIKESLARRPAYQADIEFYLERIEQKMGSREIRYYDKTLLRTDKIPAQDLEMRTTPDQ
ncbi:MAG: hypothetical protein R3C45_02410 [Phycisphaerales bacterium]